MCSFEVVGGISRNSANIGNPKTNKELVRTESTKRWSAETTRQSDMEKYQNSCGIWFRWKVAPPGIYPSLSLFINQLRSCYNIFSLWNQAIAVLFVNLGHPEVQLSTTTSVVHSGTPHPEGWSRFWSSGQARVLSFCSNVSRLR